MINNEEDYLYLSGICHYAFCKRNFSLIYLDDYWHDNIYTIEGIMNHQKADNPFIKEKRKDKFISRAMPVTSHKLKLAGKLDIVEFYKDSKGVKINGKKGNWMPYIIEYKRDKADLFSNKIQLCAEVIALEETLNIEITTSCLYSYKKKRRQEITIDYKLREYTINIAKDMNESFDKKIYHKAKKSNKCKSCSLIDYCMPKISQRNKNVKKYLESYLK
ncbi:MAG: CRISPR-associated protein Cas4 [Helcococcus sp.]|nr:CRISPR-associated protein Cas4 [Helcococcus sp.]